MLDYQCGSLLISTGIGEPTEHGTPWITTFQKGDVIHVRRLYKNPEYHSPDNESEHLNAICSHLLIAIELHKSIDVPNAPIDLDEMEQGSIAVQMKDGSNQSMTSEEMIDDTDRFLVANAEYDAENFPVIRPKDF